MSSDMLEFNSLMVHDFISSEIEALKSGAYTTLELSYRLGIISGLYKCLELQGLITPEERVIKLNIINKEVLK